AIRRLPCSGCRRTGSCYSSYRIFAGCGVGRTPPTLSGRSDPALGRYRCRFRAPSRDAFLETGRPRPSHDLHTGEKTMPRLAKPITPHLWFDKEAKEAAEFYCSIFPDSRIKSVQTIRDTPS